MVVLSRRIFTSMDLRGNSIILKLVSGWSPLHDRCLEEDKVPGQF